MTTYSSKLCLSGLLLAFGMFGLGESASGVTTRYWDCCKPSCAWPGKAQVSKPVNTCNIGDQYDYNSNAQSGCGGGSAYSCSNQEPWAVNDGLAYGFAAVKLAGKSEWDWCCACYRYVQHIHAFHRSQIRNINAKTIVQYSLTFTSGAVAGKTMIVQATNTGGDLGQNHFDLAIPGGGVGIFNGCSQQWGGINLGNRFGGFVDRSQCATLSAQWQGGCYWRFDWFKNADNPSVEFEEVSCPQAMIDRTGCGRWS